MPQPALQRRVHARPTERVSIAADGNETVATEFPLTSRTQPTTHCRHRRVVPFDKHSPPASDRNPNTARGTTQTGQTACLAQRHRPLTSRTKHFRLLGFLQTHQDRLHSGLPSKANSRGAFLRTHGTSESRRACTSATSKRRYVVLVRCTNPGLS
jgi:hypothetical protein